MVTTAVFGIPVTRSLSAGGFQDPNAESTRATNLLVEKFNQGDALLITVSFSDGIKSGAAQRVGTDIVRQLGESPYVAHVASPWTVPPSASTALTSKNGKVGLIVASITGDSGAAGQHAEALSHQVAHSRDGVTVRPGGQAIIDAQITSQTRSDLKVMETIAVPLSFLVLVWVFGGFLTAAIPLAVGGIAIFGSMAVLRVLTWATDVSIFSLNLLLAMGLALAIDYTLLILSRFRDEIDSGAERDTALVRTMVSAGRSVLFSAMTVSLSMSALMLFPMPFLKSFAYAAIAVVALAVVAAIVVTPAAITLLGPRMDSRRFKRAPRPVEQTSFYRLAHFVMRRAVPLGLGIVVLLVALGMPLFGIRWGIPDDRVLPTSGTARQVGDQLRTDFNADVATSVTVVIPDNSRVSPKVLAAYASQLSLVPDVPSVSAPGGTFIAGALVGPPTADTGVADGSAFLTVASSAPLFSAASNTQLDRLHAIAGPDGQDVLITGAAQTNRDTADAITSRLPLVLTAIALITFVVMFRLTGSLVMPLKTLLLSGLSLTAA
ncbi:MAG: MMPL family transporter, partial [Mycobacterium sp.]|nr:MMPL family transporter [Mycobacterium sp.]